MRQERRRHLRSTPEAGLEVRCTYPEHAGRADERYNLAARILNVGARGACLVTVGRLRAGAPVAVELFVPNGHTRFASRASVRWSSTVTAGGRDSHVAGISFDRVFRPRGPRAIPAKHGEAPPSTRLIPSRGPDPQRAHKRFTPEEVDLVCIPQGLLKSLGLAANTGRRLKDLSRSGAQLACAKRLKPGQRVDLRLEFRRSKITIEAEAVVRWCRRDTASLEPRYLAGVVFQNLPEGSERSLRAIEHAFLGF